MSSKASLAVFDLMEQCKRREAPTTTADPETQAAYVNHVKDCIMRIRCMPLSLQTFDNLRKKANAFSSIHRARSEPGDKHFTVNLLTGETHPSAHK